MEQSAQIDNTGKMVSEILKRVDQLIKAGDIDESIREIIRAKQIDPKHGYIRAYEERLAHLKEEHQKNAEKEKTRKEAENAARARDEEQRNQREEERQRLEKEGARQKEERSREQERITAEKQQLDREKSRREEEQRREQERIAAGKHQTDAKQSPGPRTASQAPKIKIAKKILIIDDDEQMLETISQILINDGYETTLLKSSDEAYALLKKWIPDLILCDINLETSTMGGFSFYDKVRTGFEHLHEVPFVFLTGLNDELLIRKAKEMGVDDYLTKPFNLETLLATVKGKLKRFGTFRKEK